jgi:hypothetical protein
MEADMGLMDRVKAQATVLAQRTQETAREGMARLDQATAQRHADGLLRNLGALYYADQTGRGAPDSADQIARLVSEISAHEAENGINLATQPTGWTAGVPGPPAPFADPGQPAQPGPAYGEPGPAPYGDAGQDAPGQPGPAYGEPGPAPYGDTGQNAPGQPGPAFGQPGPAGPGQPAGGSAPPDATYTQPGYTFPPPGSDDDPAPGAGPA